MRSRVTRGRLYLSPRVCGNIIETDTLAIARLNNLGVRGYRSQRNARSRPFIPRRRYRVIIVGRQRPVNYRSDTPTLVRMRAGHLIRVTGTKSLDRNPAVFDSISERVLNARRAARSRGEGGGIAKRFPRSQKLGNWKILLYSTVKYLAFKNSRFCRLVFERKKEV